MIIVIAISKRREVNDVAEVRRKLRVVENIPIKRRKELNEDDVGFGWYVFLFFLLAYNFILLNALVKN